MGKLGVREKSLIHTLPEKNSNAPTIPIPGIPPGFDLEGEPGLEGLPGIPGAPGAPGATGQSGVGSPGLDGVDGEDAVPVPGPPGARGVAGTAGLTIPPQDGLDGEDGIPLPGPMGAQGPPGVTGQSGVGSPGLDGVDGEDGIPVPGPQGPKGTTGTPGLSMPGIDGEDGVDGVPLPGPQGLQGIPGTPGVIGYSIPGQDGDEGEPGIPVPGPQGLTGIPGAAGLTIPPQDGVDGEDGIPMPGPMGQQGPQGVTGQSGVGSPGLDGVDGEDGIPVPGPRGLQGLTGQMGQTGMPGVDGVDGEDGIPVPGPNGVAGRNAGLNYSFNSSTAGANPGIGFFELDNANPSLAQFLGINQTDGDGNNLSSLLSTFWSPVNAQGLTIRVTTLVIRKNSDPSSTLVYNVISGGFAGGWQNLQVTYVSNSGTINNGDACRIEFCYAGATGAVGQVGIPGIDGEDGLDAVPAGFPRVTSTAGTLTVTGAGWGPINLEITGLPAADNSFSLGSAPNTLRWQQLVLMPTGVVAFVSTPTHFNYIGYSDAIGPVFGDGTVNSVLNFNVQSLTSSRVATWQDKSGVVALKSDIPFVGSGVPHPVFDGDEADFAMLPSAGQPQANTIVDGGIQSNVGTRLIAEGVVGAAATIDWRRGSLHTCTLTNATTTAFTFINPVPHIYVTIRVTQSPAGTGVINWPSSVSIPTGVMCTPATGSANVTDFVFYFDGQKYYAEAPVGHNTPGGYPGPNQVYVFTPDLLAAANNAFLGTSMGLADSGGYFGFNLQASGDADTVSQSVSADGGFGWWVSDGFTLTRFARLSSPQSGTDGVFGAVLSLLFGNARVQANLMQSNNNPTTSVHIDAGYTAVVYGTYSTPAGTTLSVGAGATLVIL